MAFNASQDMPSDVQKIVFWGFGNFIRMVILSCLANPIDNAKITSNSLNKLVEEMLQLRLIWHNIEANLMSELEKLVFFCEFFSLTIRTPEKIINHAREQKKFSLYEYKIMLNGSHRSIGEQKISKQVCSEQLSELIDIFTDKK